MIGRKNSMVVVLLGVMNLPKCAATDWLAHRDPAFRWHALYVKDKAEEWRYTDRFLKAYSAEGAVRGD